MKEDDGDKRHKHKLVDDDHGKSISSYKCHVQTS